MAQCTAMGTPLQARGGWVSDAGAMPNSINARTATILVVEDEVLVRVFISDVLRDEGYTVIEAVNADEALAVIRSPLKVDLVLTDMRMPGSMDGAGLVRVLRTEVPFVKVIMLAGQLPEDEFRVLLDGFLSKPIAASQLAHYVGSILPASVQGQSP